MLCPDGVPHQVLPHFDRDVRQPGRFGMVVDGEVMRMAAGIGLVVTDAHPVGGAQAPHQRYRDARILVPHDADMPRPDHLGKNRRAGMNRDHHRHDLPLRKRFQPARDRRVVGLEKGRNPQRFLLFGQVLIARYRDAVADDRERRRIVDLAVRVDDQPGKARHDGRCIQSVGQVLRQVVRADIPGDMAVQHPIGQAELVHRGGKIRAGMIRHQQNVGATLVVVGHEWGRIPRANQRIWPKIGRRNAGRNRSGRVFSR